MIEPSENVDLVQRLFEVYNERSFEENADLIDPDIVWDVSRVQLPDAATHTGREQLRKFVETWEEGFEAEHVDAQEIVDAGDRVVVMVHHRGRGKISKIEIDQRYAMVWTLRAGRAVRMDMYPSREEALEAVDAQDQPVSREGHDLD
jgi:ketosteroid isomerase-like protein